MKQTELIKRGGQVVNQGEIALTFSTLPNGVYTVTIARKRERRSLSQNDLMWTWFKCIEEMTGQPKTDVYKYYCKMFLSRTIQMAGKVVEITDTTSGLDTERMHYFMEQIKADAAQELGITLPVPADRVFEAFFQRYK